MNLFLWGTGLFGLLLIGAQPESQWLQALAFAAVILILAGQGVAFILLAACGRPRGVHLHPNRVTNEMVGAAVFAIGLMVCGYFAMALISAALSAACFALIQEA